MEYLYALLAFPLASWVLYYFLVYRKKPWKCKGKWDPRSMTPEQFEAYTAHWLSKHWRRNVKVTAHVKDGGKDVVAWKRRKKYYIECKRYTNSTVGVAIVRSIYWVAQADWVKAGLAYVWKLSKDARKFADKNKVLLLDFN